MKRFISLLLALVMVFALVACGEQKDPANTSGDTTVGSDDTTVATDARQTQRSRISAS